MTRGPGGRRDRLVTTRYSVCLAFSKSKKLSMCRKVRTKLQMSFVYCSDSRNTASTFFATKYDVFTEKTKSYITSIF